MAKQLTVAIRVCIECRSTFGVRLWPWSGSYLARTHGLCRPCLKRLGAAFDEEREAEPSSDRSVPTAA